MKTNDDHKCVSRFADLIYYNFRFILNLIFRDRYCNVILYNLKFTCLIAQILKRKVHNKLIVDVKLMNIINISDFKSVVIFFFKNYAVISFQYYVNNYDIIINNKNIIASMMSTLSRSLNLIFNRVICKFHYKSCLKIKNFS